MNISYSILTHNENESLINLIDFLTDNMKDSDEIVIVDDYSDNKETKKILDTTVSTYNIKFEQRHLNKDFASQKNYLDSLCENEYIFNIDADEIPHEILISQLHDIVQMNEVDLIWVPRVNTVEGITTEHCVKWGWRINDKGWVNYPDYQARIYKNVEHIKWINPVHETINGVKTYSHLPPQEELSLYHKKTIDKQESQNEMYAGISR